MAAPVAVWVVRVIALGVLAAYAYYEAYHQSPD